MKKWLFLVFAFAASFLLIWCWQEVNKGKELTFAQTLNKYNDEYANHYAKMMDDLYLNDEQISSTQSFDLDLHTKDKVEAKVYINTHTLLDNKTNNQEWEINLSVKWELETTPNKKEKIDLEWLIDYKLLDNIFYLNLTDIKVDSNAEMAKNFLPMIENIKSKWFKIDNKEFSSQMVNSLKMNKDILKKVKEFKLKEKYFKNVQLVNYPYEEEVKAWKVDFNEKEITKDYLSLLKTIMNNQMYNPFMVNNPLKEMEEAFDKISFNNTEAYFVIKEDRIKFDLKKMNIAVGGEDVVELSTLNENGEKVYIIRPLVNGKESDKIELKFTNIAEGLYSFKAVANIDWKEYEILWQLGYKKEGEAYIFTFNLSSEVEGVSFALNTTSALEKTKWNIIKTPDKAEDIEKAFWSF